MGFKDLYSHFIAFVRTSGERRSGDGRRRSATGSSGAFGRLSLLARRRPNTRRPLWGRQTHRLRRHPRTCTDRTQRYMDAGQGEPRLFVGRRQRPTATAIRRSNTLVLWNHATGQELWRRTYKESLRFVKFSIDGRTIFAGDHLAATRWKTDSGKRLQTWTPWKKKPPPLSNGMSAEEAEDAVLSPDGSLLLWKIKTWKADGPDRASGTGAFLRIVNTASGDEVSEIHDLPSQPQQILFSPDSRSLVIGSLNDGMFLWSSKGRLLRRFPQGSMIPVVFSRDGRTLVSTDWEPGIRIWGVRTAKILFSFQGPRNWPNHAPSAVFSPDGKRIVVGMNKRLLVLNAQTGRECRVSPGHRGAIDRLAFSADDQTLTTTCDATLWRWRHGPPWRFVGASRQRRRGRWSNR
jgi:WD40 repeat protein